MNITDIYTGINPVQITIDEDARRVYVVNRGSDTISVIDSRSDTPLKNIDVGDSPISIWHNIFTNKIYVANFGSGTVSVINASDNTRIKDIDVGDSPKSIVGNTLTDMVYVANAESDTVSVISSINRTLAGTNKILANVAFSINPENAGRIKCNNLDTPTNQYFYVEYLTYCIAESNKGFQFNSWTENLGHGSTRTISVSTISDSPLNSLFSALGIKAEDTSSNFIVTQFGNFTANFQAVPPPIPPEFWIPLYGIVVSTIIGWSIPSIIGWAKSRRDNKRLHRFHKKIKSLYNNAKLHQRDIESLDKLKSDIDDAYAKGKIRDQHYQNLKSEISILYDEIYKKRIDSLNGLSDKDNSNLLDRIKYDIEDAYAKGKISKLHYSLLNKKISDCGNNLTQ